MRGPGADRAGGAAWWIALAAVLPYLPAFGNAFVRDDLLVIRDNPLVGRPSGLWEAFAASWWRDHAAAALYRPLTVSTFVANGLVTGTGTTWGFTAVDLALHAAVALLVGRLARSLGAGAATAVAAAMVFAVHPVHVEAVAGFVGRADVLATLFVVAAVLVHRAAARDPARATRRRAATAALVLAGLLSKESAVAAFALLPLTDVLAPPRGADGLPVRALGRWRRDLPWLAAAAAAWLALRVAVLGEPFLAQHAVGADDNPLVPPRLTPLGDARGAPPLAAAASAVALLAQAARVLIWPARLSADYSYDALPLVTSVADPRLLLGATVALLVAAAAWRARRAAPVLACGAGWLALAWAPVSNLAFPIGTIFGERLLYLPGVGFALAAGAAWSRAAGRRDAGAGRAGPAGEGGSGVGAGRGGAREAGALRARAALAAGLALLLLAAGRTAARCLDWRDEESLWTAAAAAVPGSHRPDAMLGLLLMERGDALAGAGELDEARAAYARALPRLQRAVAILPEHVDANRALAWVHWQLGDPPRAVSAYERLARLRPGDVKVNVDWAAALLADASRRPGSERDALVSEAERLLDAARRWRPDSADVHYAWGVLEADYRHDRASALESFRRALELDPDHPRRAYMRSLLDDPEGIDGR